MSDEEFILSMFTLVAGACLLLFVIIGPIGRAVARRLEAKAHPPLPSGMLEEMAARLEEIPELRREIGELQERVDFAERMLTERTATAKVTPGGPP